ncbi:MAG: glycosyltransferase family 39 protein, partial [Bacteroidota bacterium]|nr:glycosyltransferase family 39 protein [Bacteroidota bacterium]
MKEEPGNNYSRIVIFILALFTAALRLYVSDNLEYHRDELLYLSLGLHPAAGYATVAPMTGWIAWIMQGIFGTSVFAVRLFPALMSAVMVYLVAAIARETGGTGYARILAAAGFIFSIAGSRTFLSLSPLHTDVFFWTLIFYLIVKYINTSSGRYLLFIGISAGAALLNNYFSGLLILSVLLVLPFTCHRNIFSQRQFRIGMLAGFLIFLPNLVWQIVNGFPALNHPVELEQIRPVNTGRAAFLAEQLIIGGMASILTLSGLIHLFTSRHAWQYRFPGTVSLAVILLLMIGGKNFNALGVYPFLMAAGAVLWDMTLKKTWSKLALLLLIVILSVPSLPIGIPLFGPEKLASYFEVLKREYKMDFVCR